MARLGILYVFAYLFTILVVADSVYYITDASNHSSPGSYYATMVLRIVFGVAFLVGAIFLDTRPRVFIPLIALNTVATFVLMIVCATFLQFHHFVPSLILHILAFYLYCLCLLDEVNACYGIGVPSKPESNNNNNNANGDVQSKLAINNSGMARALRILDQNMMAFGTLVSVIVAIVLGILIRENDAIWTERQVMYIGFIGEIFLRMLKCLILPLIFSSLVFAIGNIDAALSGKIALRAITYYFATTLIAIITGIILVVSIQPGKQGEVEVEEETVAAKRITTIDTILDLIRNVFPSNIFESTFAYYSTELKCNATEYNCENLDLNDWKLGSVIETTAANILGVVMFAIVFGVMISRIEKRQLMVDFFKSLNDIMMEMTTLVIRITPVAVTFLIMPQIIKVKDLSVMFGAIGFYTLCVVVGILFQGLVTLPTIYFVMTRKNPFALLKHLTPAMITAFGTSSSSATMPVTMTCLEEGAKLDKRVVRFCIPVGSTINMDGTALYEAVAAIFIAQYRDIDMDIVKIIIVTITATAASIGAAGIPQAGLVTMIIVLNAVGLPAEDAALIVVVDWMLDRIRTMLNVLGDAFGSAIVDHMSKNEMDELDRIPKITDPHSPHALQADPEETKF